MIEWRKMRGSYATGLTSMLLTAAHNHASRMPLSISGVHSRFPSPFVRDRDRLIGVADGKLAKAYPAGSWHSTACCRISSLADCGHVVLLLQHALVFRPKRKPRSCISKRPV
jgi:hypothetical protein